MFLIAIRRLELSSVTKTNRSSYGTWTPTLHPTWKDSMTTCSTPVPAWSSRPSLRPTGDVPSCVRSAIGVGAAQRENTATHGLDRVAAEIDWAGRNRIRYMFNADSNFGMHKRDPEIAEFLIETKRKYGFPEKFRTCWGKNTDKTVFHIANRLHAHGLEKGITLARQSNSKTVLGNVKRGNIKLETYSNLHRLFNARNIPVYTEMILGLPGETYESWRDGLEQLLKAGLKNQLLIYQCEVYPNTEFGDPDYQKKFGIRTQRIELREIHGSVRSEGWIPEFQDIVVETDSMPVADWRRMTRLSIMTMALCSMKLGHCILAYLVDRFGVGYMDFIEYLCDRGGPEGGRIFRDEVEFYDRYLDTLLSGGGRGVELPEFGAFYWDIEEASFLRCATQFDDFYAQFLEVVCHFISERGIQFDSQEIGEVVRYQRLSMPNVDVGTATKTEFAFNIPEYFARRFGTDPISVERDRQTLSLRPRDFNGDLQGFAREIILWGRKSDKIQVESQWSSVDRPLVNSQSESRQASKFAVDGLPRAANLGAL